jgi:hypothetical protein
LKLLLVDLPVGAADFPATKTDRRDLQAHLAKLPIFHAFLSHTPAGATALGAPCRVPEGAFLRESDCLGEQLFPSLRILDEDRTDGAILRCLDDLLD